MFVASTNSEQNDVEDELLTAENSRLNNEFQVIKFLGKGGFGDVVLVRNKIDGNDYAIKRIPLNPRYYFDIIYNCFIILEMKISTKK